MGDSIFENWIKYQPDFFPEGIYINKGISGQTSAEMLERFKQDVIDLHPDTVVLLSGTNDIAKILTPDVVENIKRNIEAMVSMAQQSKIKILLCSVLPVDTYFWAPASHPLDKIPPLNTWIAGFAKQQHLVFVDFYSKMVGPNGGMKKELADDGVHPNLMGYKNMRVTLEEKLGIL